MTMVGQDGAAKWCRDPEFLGRCAARLEEMMEDPKVIRKGGVADLHPNPVNGIRSADESRLWRHYGRAVLFWSGFCF